VGVPLGARELRAESGVTQVLRSQRSRVSLPECLSVVDCARVHVLELDLHGA